MPKIEIELNELLYQNFLIQICKICDEIYLREGKIVDLTFKEKERLALKAFNFLANSLEDVSQDKFHYFVHRKKFKEFCRIVKEKLEKDTFSKNFILAHISEGKLKKENFIKYLTIAILKILKMEERNFEVFEINKEILRLASIVAPIVNFSEILKREIKKGNVKIWKRKENAEELLRYIG